MSSELAAARSALEAAEGQRVAAVAELSNLGLKVAQLETDARAAVLERDDAMFSVSR